MWLWRGGHKAQLLGQGHYQVQLGNERVTSGLPLLCGVAELAALLSGVAELAALLSGVAELAALFSGAAELAALFFHQRQLIIAPARVLWGLFERHVHTRRGRQVDALSLEKIRHGQELYLRMLAPR